MAAKTDIARKLKKLGVDVVEEAVNTAMDVDCPLSVRAKIWCELIQYTQPKLKAIEITGKKGGPVQLDLFDWRVLTRQSGNGQN